MVANRVQPPTVHAAGRRAAVAMPGNPHLAKNPPTRPCENFLYGFKAAPRGRSRRRLGTAQPRSCSAPARLASDARSAGAKGKERGRGTRGSHGAAADLTREPSRRPS